MGSDVSRVVATPGQAGSPVAALGSGLGVLTTVSSPSISITTSCYPLPSICVRDPVSDWFGSLAQCLHWNVRKSQAHFTEDEDVDTEDGEG